MILNKKKEKEVSGFKVKFVKLLYLILMGSLPVFGSLLGWIIFMFGYALGFEAGNQAP